MDKRVIRILTTVCNPADEAKFNKWYNEIHVPQVLQFPGCLAAGRYRIMTPKGKLPEYVTIFEFESEDAFEKFEQVRKGPEWKAELISFWGKDPNIEIADTKGLKGFVVKSNVVCQVLGTWHK